MQQEVNLLTMNINRQPDGVLKIEFEAGGGNLHDVMRALNAAMQTCVTRLSALEAEHNVSAKDLPKEGLYNPADGAH